MVDAAVTADITEDDGNKGKDDEECSDGAEYIAGNGEEKGGSRLGLARLDEGPRPG